MFEKVRPLTKKSHKTSEQFHEAASKTVLLSIFIYADITAFSISFFQNWYTGGTKNKGQMKELTLSENLTSGIGLS